MLPNIIVVFKRREENKRNKNLNFSPIGIIIAFLYISIFIHKKFKCKKQEVLLQIVNIRSFYYFYIKINK